MNWRRFFLEAFTLVVAAVICAVTANAVASRERKLAVVPSFASPPPSARAASAPPTTETVATTSVAPPVLPATPTTITSTTTTANNAGAPTTRQPDNPTTSSKAPTPAPAREFKPHPDKAYVEIGHADVAALHAAKALFLDARRTSIYEQGHIAGARAFSVWESDIDEKVNALFSERSSPAEQDKPIVIYCSGGDCEDSHMLAQKLWGIQFNNVYVYKDGFPDWQKRGGAINSGATP